MPALTVPKPAPPSLGLGSRRRSWASLSSNPPENAAQNVNKAIDVELKRDAMIRKERNVREVKVILFGQPDSGKSTLIKQLQLLYAPDALDNKRTLWRAAVFLNILKAVRMILMDLDWEFSYEDHEDEFNSRQIRQEIAAIRGKLLPLLATEESLAMELSGGASFSRPSGARVRPGWQQSIIPNEGSPSEKEKPSRLLQATNLTAKYLSISASLIGILWRHPTVNNYIPLRKIQLDDSASYFLEQIDQIAQADYIPTNNDILRVRLTTLGVGEHTFAVKFAGKINTVTYFDVSGACGRRLSWIPYFEAATSLIFFAPISAFDEYLEDDPATNRLHHSLQLISAICANRILRHAHLVLFLNKIDLLKQKLEAGIEVQKYITSYGDRPNTYESVSDYFRNHFLQAHRRHDVSRRELHVHFSCMIDISASHVLITNVGAEIIRKHICGLNLV